jgi:hypothetical protein
MVALSLKGAPLKVVQVASPEINCVFDPDCSLAPTDTIATFDLPGMEGEATLQSRTFTGQAGAPDPAEIIRSVKKGLYAVNFGGGQVDITSGKFVFSAAESYLIEDGRVTQPVKGATLIGNGPDVLTRVAMIGNDLKLDPGIGTCGKEGQSVPVGVGQPTLRIDGLTVGGTA